MTASAFFTDQKSGSADAAAGTVKIELLNMSFEDADGDGTIGKDDRGVLNFSISNEGSKSVDVKTVVDITSRKKLDTDELQYILSGDLISKDPVLSEDKKTLTYTSDKVVLNGSIEMEDEAEGSVSDQVYYLDIFNTDNILNDSVKITYTIFAKQHRNTNSDDWTEVFTDYEEQDPIYKGIPVDEVHFPDQNFRDWIETAIDRDKDFYLTYDELVNVRQLWVYEQNISDLTGIEYFFNLERLLCYTNNLTWLDCSYNPKLVYVDCAVNQITEIDVSGCPDLYHLNVGDNKVIEVDLSNNNSLKELYTFMNSDVQKIILPDNGIQYQLKWLVDDVAEWQTEDGVHLSGSYITGEGQTLIRTEPVPDPDVEGVPVDEEHFPDEVFRTYIANSLDKDKNLVLTDDEIANVTNLQIYRKNISDLTGIEYFTNLKTLVCHSNNLTKLDVSKNTKLTYVDCAVNQITEIDVSGCPDLYHLNVGDNKVIEVDLSNNNSLKELYTHINPDLVKITLPNTGVKYEFKWLIDNVANWQTTDGTTLSGSYITGTGQTLVKITQ